MKHIFFTLAGMLGTLSLSAVGETKVTEKLSDAGDDSSVLIQRKKGAGFEKDFEVVSEAETITGDTVGGEASASASYKKACNDWKNEKREEHKNNADTKIISISCGPRKYEKDPSNNGNAHYESEGKITVRVRMRDQKK